MKVHQVLVQKEDNSMFNFGIYQSRALAESLRQSIKDSGYLDEKDKAVVIDVPVFVQSVDVTVKEKVKRKTSATPKLGKKINYQEQAQAEVSTTQLQ